MICEDLGYCCEAAFFTLYKGTEKVADRLGVSTRAIKYHKAKVRSGEVQCEHAPNCLARKGMEMEEKLKRQVRSLRR